MEVLVIWVHAMMTGVVIEDHNEFGQHWVVRATDPIIFSGVETSKLPQHCAMPSSWRSHYHGVRLLFLLYMFVKLNVMDASDRKSVV